MTDATATEVSDQPKKPRNAIVQGFYTLLGTPDSVPDPQAFAAIYRKALDGFGEDVVDKAADMLLRIAGKSWPSVKTCVEACELVMEQRALKAAAEQNAGQKPVEKRKMPWEIEVERSHEWAKRYMTESALGQESWLKGYGKPLYDYAQSYARECYRMLAEPKPIDVWRPPQDVLKYYSKYCLDGPRQSAWDKHWLIGGPKPEIDMARAGKVEDFIKRFAKARTITVTTAEDGEEKFIIPSGDVEPIPADIPEPPFLSDEEVGERLNEEEDRPWETS